MVLFLRVKHMALLLRFYTDIWKSFSLHALGFLKFHSLFRALVLRVEETAFLYMFPHLWANASSLMRKDVSFRGFVMAFSHKVKRTITPLCWETYFWECFQFHEKKKCLEGMIWYGPFLKLCLCHFPYAFCTTLQLFPSSWQKLWVVRCYLPSALNYY